MKTIGLLGGTSWESTVYYYRYLNEGIRQRLGDHNSAKILMYSFNFEELLKLKYDLPRLADSLSKAAQTLEKAGADCLMICANTLHKHADEIQSRISIPILNIIDTTGEKLKSDEVKWAGLLGTQFTMEEEFYKGRLKNRFDIDTIVPNQEERTEVHNIIYHELCNGIFKPESKKFFLDTIFKLAKEGAKAVIMGCTEIPLLIDQSDTEIPLYDTTKIHSDFAVNFSLL